MATFGGNGTTTCPECGGEMGMVTWVGQKPTCAACSGATVVGGDPLSNISTDNTMFDTDDTWEFANRFSQGVEEVERDREDLPCPHEELQKQDPDATHALVCPCPKCSVRC